MSRAVYTYTDLRRLNTSRNFQSLMRYPQITVSSDLRKCLVGNQEIDRVKGLISDEKFRVTEFHSFSKAIDEEWSSDQSKFHEMIFLSEFMRKKLDAAVNNKKKQSWLVGCMRNLDSMLSSILLLEQARVKPEDLNPDGDRNLELFTEAWKALSEEDQAILQFRRKMETLTSKEAWKPIFQKAFLLDSLQGIDTLVFHGFYYITPYQEQIMHLLEQAGFRLVFLIPYDVRYPYVYEIWDETYSAERGFDPKTKWQIEKSFAEDPYGEIFEGRPAKIQNQLEIKEYASIMEFVNDVRHIRKKGFTIYSADNHSVNRILKEYFPEEYGERKMLSYPIGQFVRTLNRMWDEEQQTVSLDEDQLIECFSSGWLAVDGVSGKQYLQDLMYILPFFKGCHTADQWEQRLELLRETEETVLSPFETELDPDIAVSRWQEAIENPLTNFSVFAVDSQKLEVITKLIQQLLDMAGELFGKKEPVRIRDHIRTLDRILKTHEVSHELYAEERGIIQDIFEKLDSDNGFDVRCHPADIAGALDLYLCGKYEEGEVQSNQVGMVLPLYFVDAACVKNRSKVHLCFSDVEHLPGGGKDYIWPLTGKKMKETYERTGNTLLLNLMQIMEATSVCNRYFTYCALKNREVTVSWVSSLGDKLLAPSPYIKLLLEAANVSLTPAARNAITFGRVADTPASPGRIKPYQNDKAPAGMVKEARMDYALCPMRYVLGYVLEKYPTWQSEFQTGYALNALISAVYHLMEEEGVSVDQVYEAVVGLFPNMRKVEKRQVYDYIAYDRGENDLDYEHRTECGGKYYTDERIKIHYPNQAVRTEAISRYGKLYTPDGRKELDLYETVENQDFCTFCPHVSYCRNAVYAVDQENYYD